MSTRALSLYLDCLMLAAVVVLEAGVVAIPIGLHEWLGIALAVTVLVHLLLQWTWIASGTRQMRAPRVPRIRVNYMLNLALFILMTVAIVSGLMVSRVVLPALRLPASDNGMWAQIHSLSSVLALVVVGLHVAMNWQWIKLFLRGVPGRIAPGALGGFRAAVAAGAAPETTPPLKPSSAQSKGGLSADDARAGPFVATLKRLTAIALSAGVVVLLTYGLVHLLPVRSMRAEERPNHRAGEVTPGGGPPLEVRHAASISPLRHMLRELMTQILVIVVSALIGRLLFRLRV